MKGNTLPRVIFVDIDGPMIPSYMYLGGAHPSYERNFSPYAVKALNEFCERTSAQIVFNSYHNYQTSCNRNADGNIVDNNELLREAATRNGILREYIHRDWRTLYGQSRPQLTRIEAIWEWVSSHPETTNWVAIDDADFRDHAGKQQILIDFDYGFTVKELNQALELFNSRPVLIL